MVFNLSIVMLNWENAEKEMLHFILGVSLWLG